MKKILGTLSFVVAALLLTTSFAQAQSATGTTSVQVSVGAEASITVTTGTTTLGTAGTVFNNYTGTTNFSYKIRTTKSGGTGSITVQFNQDLTSAPDTIPIANLSYTCTVAGPGTGGSSAQTAVKSPTPGSNVATFGTDAHSADAGTAGNSVSWTLVNNPSYKTGNYSATATFTIAVP